MPAIFLLVHKLIEVQHIVLALVLCLWLFAFYLSLLVHLQVLLFFLRLASGEISILIKIYSTPCKITSIIPI